MTQADALKALKQGYNVFLTGAAGSGKTFVLNKFIEHLKKEDIKVAVTASTGIAATHMNGITIHAWSGLWVLNSLSDAELKKIGRNARVKKRIKEAKVLIIDEVSMLHAYQLDMVDAICRRFLDRLKPFGGLQVVLCGDFFQLPPIQEKYDEPAQFVFAAHVWASAKFKVCYLNEQHRQKNDALTKVLNAIRSGQVQEQDREALASRLQAILVEEIKPTRLFSHNHDVNRVNNLELASLQGDVLVYEMRYHGDEYLVTALKNGCLAPETLSLKIGAQVMFVKNNFDLGYVNGTTGVIESFDPDTKMPVVRTLEGKKFIAYPETWSVTEEEKVLASVRQIPLRLAWAITIHKSQGMTLDLAEIDLAKSFEFGMGYVALSRVRTLSGMRLLGINDMALAVNPEVLEIDQELQAASDNFLAELENESIIKEVTQSKVKAQASPKSRRGNPPSHGLRRGKEVEKVAMQSPNMKIRKMQQAFTDAKAKRKS